MLNPNVNGFVAKDCNHLLKSYELGRCQFISVCDNSKCPFWCCNFVSEFDDKELDNLHDEIRDLNNTIEELEDDLEDINCENQEILAKNVELKKYRECLELLVNHFGEDKIREICKDIIEDENVNS